MPKLITVSVVLLICVRFISHTCMVLRERCKVDHTKVNGEGQNLTHCHLQTP